MRALVTGGAGFIGSALVDRLLAEGHTVEVVDDLSGGAVANLADARSGRGLRFTRLDIADKGFSALVAHRPPDVAYHLAAPDPAIDDPLADARAVVLGTLTLLEVARRSGVGKVVLAVSDAIYGEPAELPVKESHPHRPLTARGVAEVAVVGYLALYREQHGLEGTALVLPTVYGPRQRPSVAAVTGWAGRMRAGEPVALPGGPAVRRDLLYIDDAVDALARAADRAGGLVLNVGSGTATAHGALHVDLAALVEGAPDPVVGPAEVGRPTRMALDARRAKLHLGWEPFTPLAEGLAATVASLS